jgi:hypothetical protein
MGNVFSELAPPKHWQDFELMTLDICRARWRDDYAERNGREGQAQSGVDIFGYNYEAKESTAVQCKKRRTQLYGVDAPSSSLVSTEIDDARASAAAFDRQLDRLIIATTGPRDARLQAHVRTANATGSRPLVSLWFWDDYVEFLSASYNLMYRYYANILKFRERYSVDEHYLRMLALAFDRPAMRTAFHLENRATDFIYAISALQQAVSTGLLKDRDGHVVDQVRVPQETSTELRLIKTALMKIRTMATEALKDGRIIEHSSVIEVPDRSLQEEFNRLRREVIDNLNTLLRRAGIEAIEIRAY